MASAKEKRILERLAQIKELAAEMNRQNPTGGVSGIDLAEEAAGLALDLAELKEKS